MIAKFRYVIVMALLLGAMYFMQTHQNISTPTSIPLDQFPGTIGEWVLSSNSYFDQPTLNLLRQTDYMSKRYINGKGVAIDIYIGYYDGSSKSGGIHSPKNCLPGAGWYEVSSQPVTLKVENTDLHAVTAIYKKGSSAELFLYWFQVAGNPVNNEYALKIGEILGSIRHKRRDQAFIRISAKIEGSVDNTIVDVKSFLDGAYPVIKTFLPS